VASSGLVTDEADIEIREPSPADHEWVARHLQAWWGSTTIVGHGGHWDAARLPALLAIRVEQIIGLATFEVQSVDCHLVTLNAIEERIGVGSALLAAVIERAAASGCQRVWLTTTNDNLHAIGFYQRRGLRIVAVYPGAVDRARQTKPSIPQIGNDGIHIHDELELQIKIG
jgi:GNAT superfamily N-acetyltransferase